MAPTSSSVVHAGAGRVAREPEGSPCRGGSGGPWWSGGNLGPRGSGRRAAGGGNRGPPKGRLPRRRRPAVFGPPPPPLASGWAVRLPGRRSDRPSGPAGCPRRGVGSEFGLDVVGSAPGAGLDGDGFAAVVVAAGALAVPAAGWRRRGRRVFERGRWWGAGRRGARFGFARGTEEKPRSREAPGLSGGVGGQAAGAPPVSSVSVSSACRSRSCGHSRSRRRSRRRGRHRSGRRPRRRPRCR